MSSAPLLLRIDPDSPDPAVISQAAAALHRGELIVMPTETVYGLAADAHLAGSEERLFKAKARDPRKPIPLLAADVAMIKGFGATVDERVQRLAARFWPGPLTLVLPVSGGRFEGFRIPHHPVALALLRACGGLLRVTSANRSEKPPALTAEAALQELAGSVTIVLDAGPSLWGEASTVIRLEEGLNITVLRAGVLPLQEIENALQDKR